MKNQIAGTWALESFEIEDQHGFRKSWGKNSRGLLIYTHDGHMSVSINRAVETNSEIEAQNIYDSILFYSGTYATEDNTITHHVTQASNPQRIGRTLIRFAKHDGDKLILTSPKEPFGTAHLTWRKISK